MIKKWFQTRADLPLIIIMLLSGFLNGYNIWQDKYVNTYYTTAVASMLQNFHNFFFVSLDSAGSVSIDKPPVAFWIQTLSAYIYGLHGWSVILPQALAQVGSVLLVYLLIKPTFGTVAARLGALAMATMPVAVAVARTNNIDSMLVFTLLLATWLLFRGVRNSKTGLILASFAVVGVAFNEKMLQAYMIVPALGLFYLLAAKVGWKRKVATMAASAIVLAAVSLSWAVTIDSTPANQRPYMGSSGNNSVLSLAFGYNGVSRLTGDRSTGQVIGPVRHNQANNAATNRTATDSGTASSPSKSGMNNGGMNGGDMPSGGNSGGEALPNRFGGSNDVGPGGGGGQHGPGGPDGGGMFNTGTKGPLRLFQSELSGQASWLLPFALIACVGLLAGLRRRNITQKHNETIFWLAWLVPVAVFFSAAGFFHQYYLIMLAPPIAALFGAGFIELWQLYREHHGWLSRLLPVSVLITSGFGWYILQEYNDMIGSGWSIATLIIGIAGAALLVITKLKSTWAHWATVVSLLTMFIGPIYWALTPITYGLNSMIPAAGPSQNGGGGMNSSQGVDAKTLQYLKEHNTGETYLFAASNYSTAAPYLIDSGEKVIILNGFVSSDPVYTVDKLKALVESGQVKYFMISSGGGGPDSGNSEVTAWIKENGKEIPTSEWKTTTVTDHATTHGASSMQGERGGNAILYEFTL